MFKFQKFPYQIPNRYIMSKKKTTEHVRPEATTPESLKPSGWELASLKKCEDARWWFREGKMFVWWVNAGSPKWKELKKKKVKQHLRFIYSFGQYWLRHAVWEALWQAVGLKGNLIWVPLWKGSQTREGDCEPSAVGEGRIQMESIPVLWSCNILSYSHAPWVTVMESPDKASQIGRQVGWTKWPRIPALLDLSHNFSEPQSCQLWKGN